MRSLIAAVLFSLSFAALAGGSQPARTVSQAGVTVEVTPRALTGALWEFEVALNTHSQELKDDLAKSAVLVVDGGQPVAPADWQGTPPGGHHRKGTLRFKAPAGEPHELELRIARPGEAAPRLFRWNLR